MEQYVRVADARAWMKHNEAFPAFPSPPPSSRLQRSSRSPKRQQCGKLRCEPVGAMLPDLPESEELIKPHRSAKLKLLEGGEEDVESDPSLRNADRFVASAELPKNPFAAAPTGPGPSQRLRPADFRATLELGATSPDLRASCRRKEPSPCLRRTLHSEQVPLPRQTICSSQPALPYTAARMPTRPPAVVPTWKWPGSVQVTATAPVAQLVSPPLQSRNLPEPTDDAPSAAARASLVAAFLSPPFAYRNTLADLSTRVQRTSPAVEVGAYSWQPGMAHGIAETVKLADEPVRDPFSTAREKEVLGSPLVTRARAPSALASPPPSGTLRCRATLGSLVARQRNAGSLPCLSRSSVSNTCNQAHVKESATDAVRVRIQPPKYWVQAAVVDASEQSLRPSWSQKLAPGRRSLLPSSVCWDCSVIPRVHMHVSPPVRVILGQADRKSVV